MRSIAPSTVRAMLIMRQEVAIFDLREEAPFADAHPLFAAQLSAGRIELEIRARVPRLSTPIVLYDDGEGLVAAAARRIAALGYDDVRELEGGLTGWRDAGYQVFQDVNSYSKAFGELVEHCRHTPSLTAPEVQRLIDERADVRIVDARRFDEYTTMNIPTGVSVPGAELVLAARAVAPEPSTTIIVNCAGRTRSIIGSQSLINAGVPNPVYALRNGTIGWTLAGQTLETGQQRQAPDIPDPVRGEAIRSARKVAYRAGVRRIAVAEMDVLVCDETRTLYRFDVRSQEEYRSGHLAGFAHVPGGQLVQETDVWAPVRGARILLADDIGPRADMTASWLAQMGWDTYVVDGGFEGELEIGEATRLRPPAPATLTISAAELDEAIARRDAMVIDLSTSRQHAARHIPGARFALPADLDVLLTTLPDAGMVVLTSPDGLLASFRAFDLKDTRVLHVLEGGTDAWIAAGLPVESGLTAPLSTPRDIYKRPYEGTGNAAEKMQAYLDWEYGLVDQLERDGTHGFFVI